MSLWANGIKRRFTFKSNSEAKAGFRSQFVVLSALKSCSGLVELS